MRQNIVLRKSQAGDELPVAPADRLTRLFRLCVNDLCAVHTARADAHDNSVKRPNCVRKTDLHKKSVLGRHMSAAQYNHIISMKFFRYFFSVPSVTQIQT